jgi:hypothetical protein
MQKLEAKEVSTNLTVPLVFLVRCASARRKELLPWPGGAKMRVIVPARILPEILFKRLKVYVRLGPQHLVNA